MGQWIRGLLYGVSWYVVRGTLTCCGFRVAGAGQVPRLGGGLLCANHQSYLDPVLIGAASPRRLTFLARQSLFRFAPFAMLIRFYGAVPIQRDGMSISGIKETLRRLRAEEMVLVFPEGTRTTDGELGPLKPGIAALARRAEVPLIPIGIDGPFDAWPRTRRYPRPARIAVQFGEPIDSQQVNAWSDEQLLCELQRRMDRCLQAARARRKRL